jgi:hypothetical protein
MSDIEERLLAELARAKGVSMTRACSSAWGMKAIEVQAEGFDLGAVEAAAMEGDRG